MWDEPAFIHGIAVETPGKLIVDAAASHLFERRFSDREQVFFFCLLIAL